MSWFLKSDDLTHQFLSQICILSSRVLTSPVTAGPESGDADSDEEWPALGASVSGAAETECDAEIIVDPEDEKAIEMFMNKNPPMRRESSPLNMLLR